MQESPVDPEPTSPESIASPFNPAAVAGKNPFATLMEMTEAEEAEEAAEAERAAAAKKPTKKATFAEVRGGLSPRSLSPPRGTNARASEPPC